MQQCYHWICIQQHQSDTLCPCVCILWLTALFWLMVGQPQSGQSTLHQMSIFPRHADQKDRAHTFSGQSQRSNTQIHAIFREKYGLSTSEKQWSDRLLICSTFWGWMCRWGTGGLFFARKETQRVGIARVLLPPSSSDPWGVCGRRRRL